MLRAVRHARAILLAGLIAGVLDIAAALILSAQQGVRPVRVFQFIASGVLGNSAFRGGQAATALGLALHFGIALGAAGVYWAASRVFLFLIEHPVFAGLLYGIVVYFFMNLVVVPLSAVAQRPFVPSLAMINVHMVCVGLPIALVLSRRRS
jgi:hypothetical protein